jgi:tetratricopeptide (TPR) repeat protein/S1-C subfamily serine protease
MKFNSLLSAYLCSLLVFPATIACSSLEANKDNKDSTANFVATATQNSSEPIKQQASAITVKVIAKDSQGSGILIAKDRQTYTVITSAHVVSRGQPYSIKTPDGKTHQATLKQPKNLSSKQDIALLQFQSPASYKIAEIGDSQKLSVDRAVFAAGFPFESEQLTLDRGKVSLLAAKPLVGGYQIGFSSDIQQGMSGGALLDEEGKVIGILGQGTGAILEDVYTYQDGSRPDSQTLGQMRQSSFAIPVAAIAQTITPTSDIAAKPDNPQTAYTGFAGKIDAISQKITVLINSRQHGNGSGVIVAQQGQTYYVLTAAHVVENPDEYELVAPDGQKYKLDNSQTKILEGVDMAVVRFTSERPYTVATLGKYQLKERFWIFVSGFPKPKQGERPERQITIGKNWPNDIADFAAKDSYSLTNGYGLVYSNSSYGGMSGGPVLDSRGYVVGINTAAENEVEITEKGRVAEMNMGLSLGIPIGTFIALSEKANLKSQWLKIETTAPQKLKESESGSAISSFASFEFRMRRPNRNASALDWLNIGNLLWRIQLYEESLKAFDKAIALKSDFYQAYYGKGLVLWFADKYPEATVAFSQASEIEPSFYQAWRWKCTSLYSSGNNLEAIATCNKAIAIAPEEFASHLQLGDILSNSKRFSEAIAAYSNAIKLKPNALAYGSRGGAYKDLGQYQEAISDYSAALALDPGYDSIYNDRGLAYKDSNQYEKALADFNKVIALNPDADDIHKAYYNRGLTYVKADKYQEALADFDKAISLKPDYALAYTDRGLTYARLKQYQKALSDYDKAIKFKPDYVLAYHNRGDAYADLKEYQKAIADYNKAIQLDPNRVSVYTDRGNTYVKLKQYQEAIADCNKAIQLDPNQAVAYLIRSMAYYGIGEKEKSRIDMEKAAQLFCQQGSPQCQKVQELLRNFPS